MKTAAITTGLLLASTAAAWPGKKRYCSQAEVALAAGIHLNIVGQYGEYNGTLKVQQVEQAAGYNGPNEAFYIAKGQLESDVQAGLNIRLFNQQIAPPNNPAVAGLQQYATAQQTEKNQAANLTGDYATDGPVLEKLLGEIQQGIQLNENNLKLAVSECDFYLEFPPENESGS